MAKSHKFKSILFILNPIAGDIDKSELEAELASFCEEHQISYFFFRTTGNQDKKVINEYIQEHKPEAVFALGGDGTVNLVASLLIHSNTALGIIPLGSGNGLSKDLGIPQTIEEAKMLLVYNQVRYIDTIDINGRFSIHISDLGFNALVVKRFCEGETRGQGSYAWIALQEYLNYEPKSYKIVTDKETFEGKAFMVTIANANAWGSNANINPNGILNDGMFEICLIEPFPKAAGLAILYKLYTDSIDTSVYTRTLHCRWATIFNQEKEAFHVDGEPVNLGDPLEVKMHEKSLKVVLPKQPEGE